MARTQYATTEQGKLLDRYLRLVSQALPSSKYDRIDPSEVQALKDEISQLKAQLAESQEKLKGKEAEVTALTTRVRHLSILSPVLTDLI